MKAHAPAAFGSRLKRFRLAAGMSQEALAERAGISPRTISDLERGVNAAPRSDTLRRIASALDLAPHDRTLLAEARHAPSVEVEPDQAAALPPGRFLGAAPAETMVGRADELSRLTATVDTVQQGQGRLVIVTGEAGAGKTRLAQEISEVLRTRGFMLGIGRCYEADRTVPFFPFIEALTSVFRQAPETLRNAFHKQWTYLGALMPDLLPPPPLAGGPAEQLRVPRAAAAFVSMLSAVRPVAILLDDLHWADADSINLLRTLSREISARPVLILATLRDAEAEQTSFLRDALVELEREGRLERVTVRRLDLAQTETLIRAAEPETLFSPDTIKRIHELSDGNPFLARQLAQTAIENRDQPGSSRRRAPVDDMPLPPLIRWTVQQRLDHLSDSASAALRLASVLGETFTFDDLHHLSEQDDDALEQDLSEAEQWGLVSTTNGDDYRFDHALSQHAIYSDLPPRRAQRLHKRVVEVLQQLPEAQRTRRSAEIVQHALRSGDTEQAIPLLLEAGDAASRVLSFANAETHFRRAAELAVSIGNEPAEAVAQERLADVLERTGRLDEARVSLHAAQAIYEYQGDLDAAARVVAVIGFLNFTTGRTGETIDQVRTMRARLEATGTSSATLGRLSAAEAAHAFLMEDLDGAIEHFERAIEQSRSVGDTHYLIYCLWGRATTEMIRGHADVFGPLADEAAGLAREHGYVWDLAIVEYQRGQAHELWAELDNAYRHYDVARAEYERCGSPDFAGTALARMGLMEIARGKWLEARHHIVKALNHVGADADEWACIVVHSQMMNLSTLCGDWGDAESALLRLRATVETQESLQWRIDLLCSRIRLELRRGRLQDANMLLSELIELRPSSGGMFGDTRGEAAEVYLELGRYDEARELLNRGLTESAGRSHHALRLQLEVLRAALDCRTGISDESRIAVENTLSELGERGMPYEIARILYERGRATGSREDLEEALAIFTRLGARPDVERAGDALQQL